MAHIPLCVLADPLDKFLAAAGWALVARGKVRHTFCNLAYPGMLLVLATNRVSVFDFVLPALVSLKGDVLTAMNVLMFTEVLSYFPNHLVAYGSEIDGYLPNKFHGNADLQSRAIVVWHLEMLHIEGVVRGYLTGSGWKSYQIDRAVCGHQLPSGLQDGSELPEPIFTPTSKATSGHDLPLDYMGVRMLYGEGPERMCLATYTAGRDYARDRGIILADTKFELGWQDRNGHRTLILGDEVLTPDSSRFWPQEVWRERLAQGQSPPSMDKQFVRDALNKVKTPFAYTSGGKRGQKIVGIGDLQPENRRHRAFVNQLNIDQGVLDRTTDIYLGCLRRLSGCTLAEFKRDSMGIRLPASTAA